MGFIPNGFQHQPEILTGTFALRILERRMGDNCLVIRCVFYSHTSNPDIDSEGYPKISWKPIRAFDETCFRSPDDLGVDPCGIRNFQIR